MLVTTIRFLAQYFVAQMPMLLIDQDLSLCKVNFGVDQYSRLLIVQKSTAHLVLNSDLGPTAHPRSPSWMTVGSWACLLPLWWAALITEHLRALIIHNKGEQRSPRLWLVMAAITSLPQHPSAQISSPDHHGLISSPHSSLIFPSLIISLILVLRPKIRAGPGEDIELIRVDFFSQLPGAARLPSLPDILRYMRTRQRGLACNVTLFLDWMFKKKRMMVYGRSSNALGTFKAPWDRINASIQHTVGFQQL